MNTVKEKTFTAFVALWLVFPAIATLVYNLYIDPFQIFHKDLTQPTVILGDRGVDRYQHAGIINQYDIGSMIIGNSHSANYLPSELKTELGWSNVYTLTMDGGTLYEQSLVAERTLSKHKIKNVLWGFAIDLMMVPSNSVNSKLPLRKDLYDWNRANDLGFFLSFDMQKYYKLKQERKREILAAQNSLQLVNDEFDKATSWYDRNTCHFNRPLFVANKILRGKTLQYDEATKKKVEKLPSDVLLKEKVSKNRRFVNYNENLHNILLPIIEQYPGTVFNFVITAYPTLLRQKMKITKLNYYKDSLRVLRQFVLDTQNYSNVKIFAFDTESFTDELRLYKDRTHYHPAVNSFIVKQIAKGNNLLTASNIDDFIIAIDEKASNYHLKDNWSPQSRKEYPKSGYLSTKAANLLISGLSVYSDVEITDIALHDLELPKCAERIKRKNGYSEQ